MSRLIVFVLLVAAAFAIGISVGNNDAMEMQQTIDRLRADNESLAALNDRLEQEMAETLDKRYPGLRTLRKGENPGEEYIRYFTFVDGYIYAQLKNKGSFRFHPNFDILLFDRFGVPCGTAHCSWTFSCLNPGEEKNESIPVCGGLSDSPKYYQIRFGK